MIRQLLTALLITDRRSASAPPSPCRYFASCAGCWPSGIQRRNPGLIIFDCECNPSNPTLLSATLQFTHNALTGAIRLALTGAIRLALTGAIRFALTGTIRLSLTGAIRSWLVTYWSPPFPALVFVSFWFSMCYPSVRTCVN